MDLQDKMSKQPIKGLKLSNLKGHAKIIVRNADGTIAQQVEADNVVTNAVRDIFANDYLGMLDPSTCTPLWEKWYGGCLIYSSQHNNLDPNDYYIRNDYMQYCVAHAGHDNPDDLADDPNRGFYDTSSEVKTKNSIKQVWTWGPDAGYINVSAISLCNESLGNVGTGNVYQSANPSKAFTNFFPFEILSTRIPNFTASMQADNNIIAMINNSHGIWFEMGQPGEYANMNSRFETHYLTIYIKKFAFREVGLHDCATVDPQFNESFTIDLGGNIYCQPAYAYVGGYLWIFSNITGIGGTHDGDNLPYDTEHMNFWKIDVQNKVLVDSGTWTNNMAPSYLLGPCCLEARGWYDAYAPVSVGTRSIFTNIPYVYDYTRSWEFYFPVCDDPQSHGTAPCFNVIGMIAYSLNYGSFTTRYTFNDKQYELMNSMSSDTYPSLIVMPGRVQNQDKFWTCQADPLWVDNRNVYITQASSWAFATPYKPSSYVMPIGCWASWNAPRYLVANKFLNTTKLNLPVAVSKTIQQSMTIEYTLTQI